MLTMQTVRRSVAMAALVGACFAGRVEATPIISISPASQNVVQGNPASIDIVVSNLAASESVGGVNILLSFSDAILDGVSFALDPQAKMGAEFDFGSGFAAGGNSPLTLLFLADATLDHTALKALQGASFTLATVNFTAANVGLSPLTLSFQPQFGVFLSDALGFELPATAQNGSICVGAGTAPINCQVEATVPEPGSMMLLGTGVAALFARRRKARK